MNDFTHLQEEGVTNLNSLNESAFSKSILNRYSWILVAIWTLLMAGLVAFNFNHIQKQNSDIRFFSIVFGIIWIIGVLGILMVFARHLNQTFLRERLYRKKDQKQQGLILTQQDTINTKTSLIKSLSRFVSNELFELVGEPGVETVQPGSFQLKEVTILTADIKYFSSFSKTLNSEQKVQLINSYQKIVGPIVRKNGGFISRRIGDSIMALFPKSAESGLKAAISIQKALIDYNDLQKKKKSIPLLLGMGLFSGSTLIATVGEDSSLETTLISETVNFAWKMKYLAEQYGSHVCTNDQFLFDIENKNRYSYRFLDRVRIGETNDPINIIEILDGMLPAQLEARLATKNMFENAIEMYQARNINKAHSFFKKVFKENKNDKACVFYLERCQKLLANGIPEEWDAIENLELK